MSQGKKSLKEYLINLLEVDENKVSQESLQSMNTEISQYRKFLGELKVKEYDAEAGKIFKALYDNNITIINLLAKKKGEKNILAEMHEVYKKQRDFYENNLKAKHIEVAMNNNHSISDAKIQIDQQEYKNSIGYSNQKTRESKYYWDMYLQELDDRWSEFVCYIDKILNVVFSSYYDNETKSNILIKAPSLGEAVFKEKAYYERIKENHKECKEDEYNSNPYKNLYIYYRNSFILDFYKVDLPDLKGFLEFKNYDLPFVKDKYTLSDIAEIYKSMMCLLDDKDVYGNMKKLFQRLNYMKIFKKGGEYEFSDVSIPLAEYAYYRKKNHKEPNDIWIAQIDLVISNRYAPLLNVLINKDKQKIAVYNDFRDFILREYKDMYSTLSNSYQDSMKSFLMESSLRIWYCCMGVPFEEVYRD